MQLSSYTCYYISGRLTAELFIPDDGKDEDILLKNADIAMYQAKQGRRNRYELYKNP
jgi:GGDEF domain-containing protein